MTHTDELPLLLQAAELEPLLNDPQLLIIDVSSADNYAKGHIPGALHVAPSALVCGIAPATGKLPDPEKLSALFSQLGLTPDKTVIAYDDEGGGWAGRLIWTLDVIGHQRYACLDGGIIAWRNEGRPMSQTPGVAQTTGYKVRIDRTPMIEAEELLSLLGHDDLGHDDLAIWDTRSAEEYAGTKVLAQRGGHIPGAVHYEWTDMMDKQNNLKLLPLDEIQSQLTARGIRRDKLVVTHCQTHHRSGLSYLVARLLDYPRIKAYHGSWSEWGNRSDTPVETTM